jgi:ribosomal protein L35AE/L33A
VRTIGHHSTTELRHHQRPTSSFKPRNDSYNSLYVKGRVLGHKRGKRNSRPNTSLVQLEGVDSKEAAQFYLGKVSKRHDAELAGMIGNMERLVGGVEGKAPGVREDGRSRRGTRRGSKVEGGSRTMSPWKPKSHHTSHARRKGSTAY